MTHMVQHNFFQGDVLKEVIRSWGKKFAIQEIPNNWLYFFHFFLNIKNSLKHQESVTVLYNMLHTFVDFDGVWHTGKTWHTGRPQLECFSSCGAPFSTNEPPGSRFHVSDCEFIRTSSVFYFQLREFMPAVLWKQETDGGFFLLFMGTKMLMLTCWSK